MWTRLLPQQLPKSAFWHACILGGCAFFLLSCGNSNDGTSGMTTIRFWHFWSEPSQRTTIQGLVQEFERKYNVQVELTELSWNDGKTKLQAAFSSGAPPDVIELGSDWIAQFSSAGVLLPLPFDSTVAHQFVPYSLAPALWQGRLYAYPWTIDTRVLYANRTLLDKAGWKGAIVSLDDMARAAEMVKDHGAEGFGANGADVHRLYKKILPFMWTLGGDVIDKKGNVVFNQPANVAAFERYAELARYGYIETQRQLDAAFLQGKVALWISGSWMLPKIKASKNMSVEALLVPGVSGLPGLSFAGGEYLAVSAATKNEQRSRELVQFLTNGKQALALALKVPEAGFPADKSTSQSAELLSDPMKSVFATQLKHARMTPVHPKWLEIEAILENAMVRVLLGDATAQESLLMAQEEADALVNGS